MGILENFLHSQWVSHGNVVPNHNYDSVRGIFYLISPAGLIKYRQRRGCVDKFRNKYLNKFEGLCQAHRAGCDVSKEMFSLYSEIRKELNVSYRANARTRLRGLREWILSKLDFKIS